MARGSKSKYTSKQKRQAGHIEAGIRKRGGSDARAKRIAWATVNKESGGGKKAGSGKGRAENHSPSRKGGHVSQRRRTHASRVRAGRKAARSRKAG